MNDLAKVIHFVAATVSVDVDRRCISRRGTAYLVAAVRGGPPRWVVKRRQGFERFVGGLAQLQHAAPDIVAALSAVRGSSADWVLMDYVPGRTLLEMIRDDVWTIEREATTAAFVHIAGRLADVHAIDASAAGLPASTRTLASFCGCLKTTWHAPRVRRHLPARYHDASVLGARFGPHLSDRVSSRLLLGDARPANMIVGTQGECRFIDVDFLAGAPAQELARFLVALDRQALWYPWPSAQRRMRRWQHVFSTEYLRRMPGVARDLNFFYPWTLLQMLDQHLAQRPLWAAVLVPHYVGRLRAHLDTFLADTAAADVWRVPGLAIAGSPNQWDPVGSMPPQQRAAMSSGH